jgi:uncharacterized protein (TIGR04255 family)
MSNNQHLVEVLCAIRFDPKKNEWDSTFFGRYYELIKNRGYTERKEQRQVELQLQVSSHDNKSIIQENPPQIRMAFSNPESKSAVIMGNSFLSFHKLAPYENWEKLISDIVQPGLADYYQIGLGKGIIEVQCLYLNRYMIEEGQSVAKYFNFLPNISGSKEGQISFQARYEIDSETFVQLKLNKVGSPLPMLFFECSSFVSVQQDQGEFLTHAQKAHDSANAVYGNIIKL